MKAVIFAIALTLAGCASKPVDSIPEGAVTSTPYGCTQGRPRGVNC